MITSYRVQLQDSIKSCRGPKQVNSRKPNTKLDIVGDESKVDVVAKILSACSSGYVHGNGLFKDFRWTNGRRHKGPGPVSLWCRYA